jgi:small multidrug resistance pump
MPCSVRRRGDESAGRRGARHATARARRARAPEGLGGAGTAGGAGAAAGAGATDRGASKNRAREQAKLEAAVERAEAALAALEDELADPSHWATPVRHGQGDRPPHRGQARRGGRLRRARGVRGEGAGLSAHRYICSDSGTVVPMFAWAGLVVAILAEVAATLALKAAGDGRALPIVVVVTGYAISFYALYLVLRTLEVGTVYAIWAGTGTALVAVAGMVFLGRRCRRRRSAPSCSSSPASSA